MEMEVRGRPGVCQRIVVHQIAIVMFIWLAELLLYNQLEKNMTFRNISYRFQLCPLC